MSLILGCFVVWFGWKLGVALITGTFRFTLALLAMIWDISEYLVSWPIRGYKAFREAYLHWSTRRRQEHVSEAFKRIMKG